MAVGFTRMGADMMVVPEGALTNITAALLDGRADRPGARRRRPRQGRGSPASAGSPPQKIVRVEHSGIGSHHELVDLIGFDPARDFTIQPWLAEKLNRPLQPGDVILGAGRDAPLGSQLLIFGKPHIVYGRLGRTGVGTHERGVFMSFATLEALAGAIRGDARRAARRAGAGQGHRLPGRAGAGRHGAAGALRHPVGAQGRQGGGRRHDAERHPPGPGRAARRHPRSDGADVRQHRADGERAVLGHRHRTAGRARPPEGDRRAPRAGDRHDGDRGGAGDRRRRPRSASCWACW